MELFPSNIAVGKAFCNRVQERKILKQLVKQGRHTVLIAPRRYGKTSLINQVLLELKIPYCLMELTLATSESEVEQIIIKHISHLLYTILPRSAKAKQNILKLFKWLNPEFVLTAGGQKLVFHPEQNKLNKAENIAEILKKLDDAAKVLNKQVIVVMDEFQQLNDIDNHTTEAAIRHAMQYSKHTSYVFSGSNRHMLKSMFNNKNRPFYNSCELMKLDRISKDDYHGFIQQAAIEQWKKPLSDQTLNKIFELTQLHPSYINRICGYFWLMHQFPTEPDVETYWYYLIESKRSEFTEDILRLGQNQKKVLAYLAKQPTQHPSGKEICMALNIPEASIRQAVHTLLLKDYIYKDALGFVQILDPALRDFIKSI